MKKRILVITLFSVLFLGIFGSAAKAAYTFRTSSGAYTLGKAAGFDVSSTIKPEYYVGLILTIVFSFVGLIFFGLALLAGIKWMTAKGNTAQVEQSKVTLNNAIIGLIISLLAYAITVFIFNLFQNNTETKTVKDQSRIELINNKT